MPTVGPCAAQIKVPERSGHRRRTTMARSQRKAQRGVGSTILGALNPIRDPSLLVAIVLTVIWEGSSGDPLWRWAVTFVAAWIAAKSFVWLLVNMVFSSVYLFRKTGWVLRNPRLAWRLLDALGTEEIIIGGLRPDMFATEDGALHMGSLGAVAAGPGWDGGAAPPGYAQPPRHWPGAPDGDGPPADQETPSPRPAPAPRNVHEPMF